MNKGELEAHWMCRRGFGRVYYIFGSEEFWAEVIMDLVEKSETVEQFYAKLKQNGACWPTFWFTLHIYNRFSNMLVRNEDMIGVLKNLLVRR